MKPFAGLRGDKKKNKKSERLKQIIDTKRNGCSSFIC
jgi:hypothetical protein